MKLIHSAVQLSALVLAIGASFAATDAQAVTLARSTFTNPVGVCQGALPNYEGAIKKRPLALENVGTGDAFITCSYATQGGPGVTSVTVEFTNGNDAVRLLKCTGVSGYAGNPQTEYVLKQSIIQPGGAMASLVWNAADFQGAPSVFPSVNFSISCNLEPNMQINRTRIDFLEDVGA